MLPYVGVGLPFLALIQARVVEQSENLVATGMLTGKTTNALALIMLRRFTGRYITSKTKALDWVSRHPLGFSSSDRIW